MQMEAEVPRGVQPGQVFTVQTPTGLVQVKAPSGSTAPGQRVRFQAPGQGGAAPLPRLLGSEDGNVVPLAYPVPAAPAPAQGYRIDPMNAKFDNLPLLKGIPEGKAERKIDEIKKGGQLARDLLPFPTTRKYMDIFWILPFLAMVVAMVVACFFFARSVEVQYDGANATDAPSLKAIVLAGTVGGIASIAAAFLYIAMAHKCPACVVWTSLLFTPCLLIAGGVVLLAFGQVVLGLICGAIGLLYLTCVFVCYRPLIPFMIKLVEVTASVMRQNPTVVGVSVLGSLAGLAWSIVCGITFVGAYLKYKRDLEHANSGEQYVLYFVCVLIFVWGAQVTYNVCHVTYCGVFGRWYFNVEQSTPVRKSLWVALTTSFGSICFGSFLIAAIRALEAVIRLARRQAQEDGNIACCVILLVMECVVSCIGDILEYFSEWAYVQCAVRGASFMDAARITYSLLTCANLLYVVQDLLVDSVVNLGALFCGFVGCAVGAGTGFALGSDANAIGGAVIGLWAGLMAGGSAAGIISSGTKTILAMWAESPEPLRQTHPEIHEEFEQRILAKMNA